MLADPVWLVAVGVLAGALPGVFGFGGGWLLVPILLNLLRDGGDAYAPGIALCAILAGASSGVAGQILTGRGELKELDTPSERAVTVVMVAAGFVGTVIGKVLLRDWIASFASATLILDGVLVVVLLVIAGRLTYEAWAGYHRQAPRRPDAAYLAGLGLATLVPGALSGLMGIGGGILYVPILLFFLHWRTDEARAASRLVVVASALVGTGLYAWSGGVDFATAAAMFVPAGIVGVATSGIRFSHSAQRRRSFRLLTGALALLALGLTIRHMLLGATLALPQGPGGAGAVALATGIPLAWGAVCGVGQLVVAKYQAARAGG